MIQRIQSIYFLLAALLAAFSAVFFWVKSVLPQLCAEGECAFPTWGVATFSIQLITALLPLIAIFLYKNRGVQVLMGSFARLFVVAALGFLYVALMETVPVLYHCLTMIPMLLSFVLLQLATRAIKRDEELVRAADRIR